MRAETGGIERISNPPLYGRSLGHFLLFLSCHPYFLVLAQVNIVTFWQRGHELESRRECFFFSPLYLPGSGKRFIHLVAEKLHE